MNRTAAFVFGMICFTIGLLLRPEPAATQSPDTSLGSLTVQNAKQRITVPTDSDIMLLYRGQNGDAAYTQSATFMFAMSAANAQANFGGL